MSNKSESDHIMDVSNDPMWLSQYMERKFLKDQIENLKNRVNDIDENIHTFMKRHKIDTMKFGPEMGLKRTEYYQERFQKNLLEEKYPGLYDKCKKKSTNLTERLSETTKV